MIEKCRDEIQSDKKEEIIVEKLKVYIAGQLRKGMDKAVVSAVMKLNERVR